VLQVLSLHKTRKHIRTYSHRWM